MEAASTGPVRLPRIYGDVTVEGNGATIRRASPLGSGSTSRLFHIQRFGSLVLQNLTVEGFRPIGGGIPSAERSGEGRAALNDGVLRTTSVIFQDNREAVTNYGYARLVATRFIENVHAFTNATRARASFDGVEFVANRPILVNLMNASHASAFEAEPLSDARMISTTFSGNFRPMLRNDFGMVEIALSTIISHQSEINEFTRLGDLIVNYGDMTIRTSTISDNGTERTDDLIWCSRRNPPLREAAALALIDTTVVDNRARTSIGISDGNCTLSMLNTVVSTIDGQDCRGASVPFGGSADTDGTCGTPRTITGDLRLASLNLNGGVTFNRLPLTGSPLIDTGQNCEAFDQRLLLRPQGQLCDIGAVEVLP